MGLGGLPRAEGSRFPDRLAWTLAEKSRLRGGHECSHRLWLPLACRLPGLRLAEWTEPEGLLPPWWALFPGLGPAEPCCLSCTVRPRWCIQEVSGNANIGG